MTFDSPNKRLSFAVDLQLSSIVEVILSDGQELPRSMERFNSVESLLSSGDGSPSLVAAVSLFSLNYL